MQKREGCITQMRVPGVLPQLQHLLEFHSVFNFPFIIYPCGAVRGRVGERKGRVKRLPLIQGGCFYISSSLPVSGTNGASSSSLKEPLKDILWLVLGEARVSPDRELDEGNPLIPSTPAWGNRASPPHPRPMHPLPCPGRGSSRDTKDFCQTGGFRDLQPAQRS